jgi:hypothetical protein
MLPRPRIAVTIAAVLFGLFPQPARTDVPPSQVDEVQHLLAYLEQSDCAMVRNGRSYSGAEGARHVRRKYHHFREEIDSTERFVELSATRSLRSDQPYEVHCPGEAPRPSAEWLLEELFAYRARSLEG